MSAQCHTLPVADHQCPWQIILIGDKGTATHVYDQQQQQQQQQ